MLRPKRRLAPEDWIRAGLAALREGGSGALRAEPLARRLGATKGSFYWHFADVPAYHTAVLAYWQAAALQDLSRSATVDGSPAIRLRSMAQAMARAGGPGNGPLMAEPGIRAWARCHDEAAASVARLDAERQDHLRGLLAEIGVGNPEMARIILAAALGMQTPGRAADTLSGGQDAQAIGSLVDMILALR